MFKLIHHEYKLEVTFETLSDQMVNVSWNDKTISDNIITKDVAFDMVFELIGNGYERE